MALQQDKGGDSGARIETGLPAVQTSEDVPRWLVVLGLVAGLTLLVALLRYAIDLLGVVFLIIVVGFSIRALSDWLTEGESVSRWATAAVTAGLCGTALVGLWLFGPHDRTAGVYERTMPVPVLNMVEWLETKGWGQRVLLSSSGPSSAASDEPGASGPAAAPTAEGGAEMISPRGPSTGTSGDSPRVPSPPGRRARTDGAGAHPGAADAATVAVGSHGKESPRGVGADIPDAAAGAALPAREPAAAITTTMVLESSQPAAQVGTSVRFTARVSSSDGTNTPRGAVVFFRGDSLLGRVPVRQLAPGTAEATLATLNLPIGTHQVTAEFHGAEGFANCRSASMPQTVRR
jgi:Bacterial Ig-like domain (group 3)